MRLGAAVIAAVGLAALSLLLVAPAPSYDPWAWLLWGREIAHLELSTEAGPAFKPLTVAVCVLLAPLGSGVAPVLWVFVARAGAALAAVLAYALARDLAGGSRLAGTLAAAAVALTAGYLGYAASGTSEGLLVALALAAILRARGGHHRSALALAAGCALLRVEAWPFAAAYALWRWRRAPGEHALVAAGAVAVPALWLVPELFGSGDLLRSGSRARTPNPGQPALADVPAWAALREAVELALWPMWIGLGALALTALGRRGGSARPVLAPPADPAGRCAGARPALALAATGAAWIALVALMAQAGFSGEARYALPGVALLAVAGAVGIAAVPRPAAVALAALLAVAAVPRIDALERVRDAQRHQWDLAAGLRRTIAASGGRDALLRCGRPYVGHLRGPLLAYHLDVAKRQVGFVPSAPGVIFASRRTPASPVEPSPPAGFRPIVAREGWTISVRCA